MALSAWNNKTLALPNDVKIGHPWDFGELNIIMIVIWS